LAVNQNVGFSVNSPSANVLLGTTSNVFNVNFQNTGNTDLSVIVSESDLTSGTNILQISASSPQSVSYGSTQNIPISVSVPSSQIEGTYTGNVTFTAGGVTHTSALSVVVKSPEHSIDMTSILVPIDYSDLDDDDDNLTETKKFTIENKGDYSETIVLTFEESSSKYNDVDVEFSKSSFTLASGASEEITLTANLPFDLDSGEYKVGEVRAVYYNNMTAYEDVKFDVKSMLELNKIVPEINGKKKSDVDSDGDKFSTDFFPGDEIKLIFHLENLFDHDDYNDGDIEVTEVRVEMDDDDFEDDIDETYDDFDIDAHDDSDEAYVEFDVPEDAKEGDYTLEVTIEGEDDNGAKYVISWDVDFEVKRTSDDVRIRDVRLGAESVQCVRNTHLYATLVNFGSNNQDDVRFTIENEDLGIDYEQDDIELDDDTRDDDNEYDISLPINIASDVVAGSYTIKITAYIDRSKSVDAESIVLEVEDCASSSGSGNSGSSSDSSGSVNPTASPGVNLPVGNGSGSTGYNLVETVEKPFTESTSFFALLILANLAIVAVILFLVFKFLF